MIFLIAMMGYDYFLKTKKLQRHLCSFVFVGRVGLAWNQIIAELAQWHQLKQVQTTY